MKLNERKFISDVLTDLSLIKRKANTSQLSLSLSLSLSSLSVFNNMHELRYLIMAKNH